jgi:hypothetical protein
MERNENPIYDYYMDQKMKAETPKSTQKVIIRRPLKQTIKQRSMGKNRSRHAIYKINRGFKSIISKPEWCFTLP